MFNFKPSRLESLHCRRAIQAVAITTGCKSDIQITNYMFHAWTGSIITLTANGVGYVCKVTNDPKVAIHEWRTLKETSKINEVNCAIPIGLHKGVLVERQVDGCNVAEHLNKEPQDTLRVHALAIEYLGKFHRGIQSIDQSCLDNQYEQ